MAVVFRRRAYERRASRRPDHQLCVSLMVCCVTTANGYVAGRRRSGLKHRPPWASAEAIGTPSGGANPGARRGSQCLVWRTHWQASGGL